MSHFNDRKMCTPYLFQMWSFFIRAWLLYILLGYFTEFMTSFVWFKFSQVQLDTFLKTLLKQEKDKHYDSGIFLLLCTFMQADQTYKSTKVYVPGREWVLSYFLVTTTNCSKRMHYNHLNWHLFHSQFPYS